MGPYRTNAAPLRARREELRLELEDVRAKMSELEAARSCIDRAIDDIDVKLQTGLRPSRYRRTAVGRIVLLFAIGVGVVSAIILLAVLMAPATHSRCVVSAEPGGLPRIYDGARPYPASRDVGTGP